MQTTNKENIDILIIDFLNRKISPDNLAILNQWVNTNEENRTHFTQLKSVWMLSSANQNADPDIESSYNLFKEKTRQNKPEQKRPVWKKYAAYAATVAALLIITVFATNLINNNSTVYYTKLNIPRAAKLNLTLPDGSTAWINADSKLQYSSDFGKKDRNISLEGEGYFEVIPGEIPFMVSTDSAQVKVLGTKFNVRNYKEDKSIKVSLFEGEVVFSNGIRDVYLKPSQTIELNKISNTFSKRDINIKYVNQWINNQVFYDATSFEDIAIELERLFNVNIFFESEELKKLTFYGDFIIEANNLGEILDVMYATNKFEYKYQISHNEVYISK